MLNLAIVAAIVALIANAATFMLFVHYYLTSPKTKAVKITAAVWITATVLDLMIIGAIAVLLITSKFLV